MLYAKPLKHKQKSRHKSNEHTEYDDMCEICRRQATETHEWFNGSDRKFAIDNKAQSKLCNSCHHKFTVGSKKLWLPYQRKHQLRIMYEKGWNEDQWRRNGVVNGDIIRKSYL